MTATPPLPSRDFRTAALILVGIAAALALAWRAPSDLPPPVVAASAPAPGPAGTPAAAFNLDTAMRLAGTQVPPELDSFYFFAMLEPAPEAQDIAELGSKMQAAARERDYLGVAGPDPERNRRTLLAALEAHHGEDLSGMILIYLGPDQHRAEVASAARAAGVELRFVAYPEASTPL
ncbi:MAG: hypothetical protein NTW01_05265 [Gammaproteobacteria bacterium]|jgi:hypothetical protein|nr:hypothetical protein [Gammaproteobacteria bacterium]